MSIMSILSTITSYGLTIASFALVLGVLVFFHELGHYWVARRNGIVVEEFGMGYPPRLIKLFRYDGTDFTLNWLPLGGFARMKGEDAGDMSPGSFNAATRWGRAATLFAGPLMNFILAIVLFTISFVIGGVDTDAAFPQVSTVQSPAATRIGLQANDLLLKADDNPVLVNALADSIVIIRHPKTADTFTLTLLRNGTQQQLDNVSRADLSELLDAKEYKPVLFTRIEGTAEKSPAQLAGIQPGDLIYAVNGELVTVEKQLPQFVDDNLGKEIELSIVRDFELVKLSLTPRANPPANEGKLGVRLSSLGAYGPLPFLTSVRQGILSTFGYVTMVIQLPVLFFLGQISPEVAQVSGPIGIAREVGGAVRFMIDSGVPWPIWRLAAVLSAALAITNLLPIPALDGGRLLFILIETIRGRRISPEREGFVHMIGFLVLLSLMVVITIRDIISPSATIDWSQLIGG